MNSTIPNVDNKSSRFGSISLLACLVLAIGARLLFIARDREQLTIDRDAYLSIAKGIAEGRGYCVLGGDVPTAFRPPLYPILVGIISRGVPVSVAVAAMNLVCGVTTILLTADLSRRLRLGAYGLIAVLFVAIDPLLLQYSSRPMTESLCTFLSVLWVWSVVACWPSSIDAHVVRAGFCGITFGLLVLSRPTFWPIAGFCGLIWLFTLLSLHQMKSAAFRSQLLRGVWAAVCTTIVVAPWLIRNWMVFGVPILTTTHGGYTLLLGNNPVFYAQVVSQPWGTTWPDDSQHKWEEELNADLTDKLGPNASEIERDAWQSALAKSYIRSEPGHFAEAVVHRIRSLWNTVPLGDAARDVNGSVIKVVGWYYTITLILALVGLIRVGLRRDRSEWLPVVILIVSVQIVHLAYWTNTRMRAPLTPAIALFAAAAIAPKRVSVLSV